MQKRRKQQGSVFVEYALLIGAIVVVAILAFAVLGHKTNDIVATGAALLPGAHDNDDVTFTSGKLVEWVHDGTQDAEIDTTQIGGQDSERLGDAVGVDASTIVK